MRAFILVYWASALAVQGSLGVSERCEMRIQWIDNVCRVGGSLLVKSVPNNLEVSSRKCDGVYNTAEFQKQPLVSYPDAESGKVYVLVIVDPDVFKQKGKYFLHWILANIPGDDFKKGDLKNATTISSYSGPAPPEGTGIHRYLVMVFRQPTGTRVDKEIQDRMMFDLEEFITKYQLCGPLSGVQFRCKFSGND